MTQTDELWWRHAVGYEVYIRSFADGNDDGIGDLVGLHERLDHLAWLGVDVLWITPFYESPMADFGYDVANYVAVDPRYGTLDDFDRLIAKAKQLGIKVVIDVVPNHSSDQHEWFQKALADPSSEYRDYYLWCDKPADGGLPNNWVGYFGGPTWTLDEASDQYYLHLFLSEQPDLNWRNPKVIAEFETILRFWLDRGVDGFRIDVAQALVKDRELRSNPELAPVDHNAHRLIQWNAFEHRHDILQPETIDVFRGWRKITAEYGAVLIGETYVLEPEEIEHLLEADDALDVGFWFSTMHMAWDAEAIASTIAGPPETVRPKIGWVLSSHDEHRPPSRFGGGAIGERRSLALTVLLFGLPGMPFLYQGEELGLPDGDVAPENKADPVGDDDPSSGRDGCRTPMPWDATPNAGFSGAASTWLPIGHSDPTLTVAAQRSNPSAIVHRYRELLSVRRGLPELADAPVEFEPVGADAVVCYRRDELVVLLNAGDSPVELPGGQVLFHSAASSAGQLDPDTAAIVRCAP